MMLEEPIVIMILFHLYSFHPLNKVLILKILKIRIFMKILKYYCILPFISEFNPIIPFV